MYPSGANSEKDATAPPGPGSRTLESGLCVLAFSALMVLVFGPAFTGYFFGEDFNWFGVYLTEGHHLWRAAFTPLGPLFRPFGAASLIASQLLLPWDPLIHHIRSFIFCVINILILHRIMLRLTTSSAVRVVCVGVFAMSRVQFTLIGNLSGFEQTVALTSALAAILFILRFLQSERRLDYVTALALFFINLFAKDQSAVLIVPAVLLFLWFPRTSQATVAMSFRIRRALPFVAACIVYSIVRIAIVGMPQVGSHAYAFSLQPSKLVVGCLVFVSTLLNVTLFAQLTQYTGGQDLIGFLRHSADFSPIYGFALVGATVIGGAVLIWRSRAEGRMIGVLIAWLGVTLAPPLLIMQQHLPAHYFYEAVAVAALLFAVLVDRLEHGRKFVTACLCLFVALESLNGYAQAQNLKSLTWRYCSDRVRRINDAIFQPYRCRSVRSLAIISESQAEADNLNYLINCARGKALLKALFSPAIETLSLPVGTVSVRDSMPRSSPSELTFRHRQEDYSFSLDVPVHVGRCESFEKLVAVPRLVWVANTQTSSKISDDPRFTSDGGKALQVSITATGIAANHYGGVELPLSSVEFRLRLFVDAPRNMKTLYAYEYDQESHLVSKWVVAEPEKALKAGTGMDLVFRTGANSEGAVLYRGSESGKPPKVLHLFADLKDGGAVTFYIDSFCTLESVRSIGCQEGGL